MRGLLSGNGGMFAALGERDFAWFFGGNMAFHMTFQMGMLLRGYLAYDLTNLAVALGLVSISFALPTLLVAPLGGVLADRYNKRRLMLVTQSAIALINLALATLLILDAIEFWQLMTGTILTGIALPLCMPSRNAVLPLLVPQHRITNAVSLSMGGQNLTRIIGPSAAGLLIAPLGLGVVWALIVVLEVASILSLLRLPSHGMRSTRASGGFVSDVTGGFRYITANRLLALLVFSSLLMPLLGFPIQQALPVFAEDVFQRGPDALGFLMAAAGVGGFSGAILATALDRVRRKGRLMLAGSLLMSGCYLAFAFAPTFGAALVLLGAANVGGMLFQTTNQSTVQAMTSDEMRGRVWAVLMMSFGVTPLAILPLTIAIDELGASAAVAGSSVLMLVILMGLFIVSPRLRTLSMDSLDQAELSPVEAARLVAEGRITQEEALRLTGRA